MHLSFLEKILGMIKLLGRLLYAQNVILDKIGKRTANYEELLEYITNVYYVLMTTRNTKEHICTYVMMN